LIIYSKIFNSYSSDFFLIKYLRQNKWLWDYKFFFDHLSNRDYIVLLKNLLTRSNKIVFVKLEGQSQSWRYFRPINFAEVIFGFSNKKKHIYWTVFFDEVASGPIYDQRYMNKSTSNLIPEVVFISGNVTKIAFIQKNYPELYKKLSIFGEFHKPIDEKKYEIDYNSNSRQYNSLATTSNHIASLNIENNQEEGYAQCSALWALRAMTPPILKSQPARKNFIRPEFYIDFYDYLKMTEKQRLTAISKVQERLLTGENYLTNLTKDYIEFFRESFSGDQEPDFKTIAEKSQYYRSKFVTT